MLMKYCGGCERDLNESEFGRNAALDDGLARYCRECARQKVREHRLKSGRQKPAGWTRKTADMKAYRRQWREANADYRKQWLKAHPGAETRYKAAWYAKHRERRIAKDRVKYAVKTGKLKREPCVKCGEKAEAHHPDYSKPLDIVWLCPTHHREHHKQLRDSA